MLSTLAHRRIRVLTGHLAAVLTAAGERTLTMQATNGTVTSGGGGGALRVGADANPPPGSLSPPLNALRDDPLASAEETARREAARAMLPWNRRVLDAASGQVLHHVGEPTARFLQSGLPTPALFQPFQLGPLKLKNRIVVSPMCTYSSEDGFLNDWHLVHLGQFALGGAGLVVVEATHVCPEGRISPLDSGLWKDDQIEPLRRIVALLHSQNCRAGIQIAHAGRKASTRPPFQDVRRPAKSLPSTVGPELGGWPERVVGPSEGVTFAADYPVPHELSVADIQNVKQLFLASIRRALAAGFEYIEIHAAHGYLLSSFLSATSNKRTDQYGGSFDNRVRMLVELVREARALVPRERAALGVRLSCSEWLPADDPAAWRIEDTVRLVGLLQPLGVDLIDCSSGGNHPAQKIPPIEGYQVPFAEAVKRAFPCGSQNSSGAGGGLAVGAVGLITDPLHANSIVEKGQADLVFLAREMLRDPHWPLRAAAQLGFDMEWAPQYQRAKPSMKSNKTLEREEANKLQQQQQQQRK
jgi:2,4-dienoyl-CoA reductase-like NADH-dependent reductase (Old Yellow Enzyme family)